MDREQQERIEVLEHDLAFLGRALIRALEQIDFETTADQVQKMVDFYERKEMVDLYERKDQWPK